MLLPGWRTLEVDLVYSLSDWQLVTVKSLEIDEGNELAERVFDSESGTLNELKNVPGKKLKQNLIKTYCNTCQMVFKIF